MIDPGSTSHHERPVKRRAHAGSPASGSATIAACAATRTTFCVE
jgi:hypothetical protein